MSERTLKRSRNLQEFKGGFSTVGEWRVESGGFKNLLSSTHLTPDAKPNLAFET